MGERWVRGVANRVNKHSFNATFLYPLLIEEKELRKATLSVRLAQFRYKREKYFKKDKTTPLGG